MVRGHCGYCRPCRKGDFINCIRMPITGVTRDGGYAEYIAIDASAWLSSPTRSTPGTPDR